MNKKIVFLLQIAFVALSAGCRKSPPPEEKAVRSTPLTEYWIGTDPDTLNLGTIDQPFDGSTREKYDRLIPSILGPCVIHLRPGIFWTWGSYGNNLLNSGISSCSCIKATCRWWPGTAS